jgi:hypothetical protein
VKMYITCCIVLVKMVIFRSRLKTIYLSASKSVDESEPTIASFCKPMIDLTSIEASACCAENSDVFASLSCLGCLVDSDFFGLSSNWRERQCKFLSDWQQICCVFNEYLRKYYCGTRKISLLCKKLLTSM